MLRCLEIQGDPELVERYIDERLKLYADCPPSLPLLSRSKVFAVFRDEVMVGGFTLFVGETLPFHDMLPPSKVLARAARRRADCEIGVVWLNNLARDAELSIAFWRFLIAEAAAVRSPRYFFRYDCDSRRLAKIYRFAFAKTLHVAQLTTATGRPLRLAICRVPLVMMRFNLALYALRRHVAERFELLWHRLARGAVRALPEEASQRHPSCGQLVAAVHGRRAREEQRQPRPIPHHVLQWNQLSGSRPWLPCGLRAPDSSCQRAGDTERSCVRV